MERDFVKETKSRYGDDNRAWSQLPFVREINLVRADFSGPNISGDLLKWRANSETCCTYVAWVCNERFITAYPLSCVDEVMSWKAPLRKRALPQTAFPGADIEN